MPRIVFRDTDLRWLQAQICLMTMVLDIKFFLESRFIYKCNLVAIAADVASSDL
jgi:hypothetical protein